MPSAVRWFVFVDRTSVRVPFHDEHRDSRGGALRHARVVWDARSYRWRRRKGRRRTRRQQRGQAHNEDRGLSAYCFFGFNQYNTRIKQQLEEPGRDEKVDGRAPQIAEALGTLEWY